MCMLKQVCYYEVATMMYPNFGETSRVHFLSSADKSESINGGSDYKYESACSAGDPG